jgi:hypothetical protein
MQNLPYYAKVINYVKYKLIMHNLPKIYLIMHNLPNYANVINDVKFKLIMQNLPYYAKVRNYVRLN